jgi:hypothetical protein
MRHLSIAAAACLALCAPLAQADAVNLSGYTHGAAKNVNVSIDLAGTASDRSYGGGAGEFTGTWNGASFQTYCLDLYEFFRFGTTYNDYHLTTIDAERAQDIGRLVTKYRGDVDTMKESAAFQVALWEITYENTDGYDLFAGSFKETAYNDGVRALAQSWLADLGTFSNVKVFKLESLGYRDGNGRWVAGHQDFLVTTPIPEPSTTALMIAGLLGIGFIVTRRRG